MFVNYEIYVTEVEMFKLDRLLKFNGKKIPISKVEGVWTVSEKLKGSIRNLLSWHDGAIHLPSLWLSV